MFNFLQHLFTARVLELTNKELERKYQALEGELEECKKRLEIANKALHEKTPEAFGVSIEPPQRERHRLW